MFKESLSLRAYTRTAARHAHTFCQLVLPLNGAIHMQMKAFNGKVGVGEGIMVPAQVLHTFSADEKARFIVADLASLPAHFQELEGPKFRLTDALSAFLSYAEIQFQQSTSDALEHHLVEAFKQLLLSQRQVSEHSDRIEQAISYIQQQPSAILTVNELARRSCLGETQFKKRFKAHTGISVGQYITQTRMRKAQALLRFTDMPVSRVAEEVGYYDMSAFSRRFTLFFGRSPKHFSRL